MKSFRTYDTIQKDFWQLNLQGNISANFCRNVIPILQYLN